ncbi:MAG: hypothetical protein SWO11_22475 [Thermodesulfobacteriota bacterium]|nr:hypothetical protein [Thermodesulfobacteriota bacterium]
MCFKEFYIQKRWILIRGILSLFSILPLIVMIGYGCYKPGKKTTIEFWTSEVAQDRMGVQRRLAKRFYTVYPGIDVHIVPVDKNILPEKTGCYESGKELARCNRDRIGTAQRVYRRRHIATKAYTEIICELGEDSFYNRLLKLCLYSKTEEYAAAPIDGWVQGIW